MPIANTSYPLNTVVQFQRAAKPQLNHKDEDDVRAPETVSLVCYKLEGISEHSIGATRHGRDREHQGTVERLERLCVNRTKLRVLNYKIRR